MVKAIAIAYFLLFVLVVYRNNGMSRSSPMATASPGKDARPATNAPEKNSIAGLARGMQGYWNIGGETGAVFIIKGDRMIIPEMEAEYPFTLQGDRMQIDYGGHKDIFIVSLRGPDTLVLTGPRRYIYSRFNTARGF